MSTSFFSRSVCRTAMAAAICVASGGASAAVIYTYSGPMQYYNTGGEGSPWSGAAGRYTGAVVFDDSVTSTFTGTVQESAFTGSLSYYSSSVGFNHGGWAWPALVVAQPFFFTFVNGQVVDWLVGGAYGDAGGGGEYYSWTSGDGSLRYRVMAGIPGTSSQGVAGMWTREDVPSAVPLPLTAPLLVAGLLGLAGLGRRRKA